MQSISPETQFWEAPVILSSFEMLRPASRAASQVQL